MYIYIYIYIYIYNNSEYNSKYKNVSFILSVTFMFFINKYYTYVYRLINLYSISR